eukprot:TRINITY_DN12254_c0_g1_i1.p1 TRINITY_DN12254_c0_g1~~TRINITY_DN12254_c0_g1_i1.p1  ORF type:complete len:556 (+),score=270.58 TRINITY_DN12254_c0_g1_i1:112-1779(+)
MSAKRAVSLGIDGTRTSGEDVRTENVTAAVAIANIVKTSLGPMGLDKMLVDEMGEMLVSNDGATILQKLEVEHPAAKVLVDLAKLQDDEVGDGTTSVVVLAAELLKRANVLVQQNIHPTVVIGGYKMACKEALKYIREQLTLKVGDLPKDTLINVARTSMASKVIGLESEHFAKMCVDAMNSVRTVNDLGDYVYPVKAVNILKQHGKSSRESTLVKGFALNCTRASQAMPTGIKNAKIALLDVDLRPVKMRMGIQILLQNPEGVEEIKKREIEITKERIEKVLRAGANVILTTKGIDDTMLKYLVEQGCYGVRRCKKDDLKQIAKVCGGQLVTTFGDLQGEESFDPAYLGAAEKVYEQRFADDECTIIEGTKGGSCSSIVLRGANSYMLDEMHRSVNDALFAVSRTLEANAVVAGGGAVEVALNAYLEAFAVTLASREQLAIAEFAQALMVIPKQLAVNAALDATDLVAKLKVQHVQAQKDEKARQQRFWGLDLMEGNCRNNVQAGVLEPAPSKEKSLRFATEAAITILRIDDLIRINDRSEEEQEEMMRARGMM